MKTQLLKVSTYARENKISVPYVYKQISEDKLKTKVIDGVIFIVVKTK